MANVTSIVARHAHYLEQFINGSEDKLTPFLRRVVASIRKEMTKRDFVPTDKQEKMLDFIEALVLENLTEFTGQLQLDIADIAEAEAEFTQGMLSNTFDMETDLPSPAQLRAAVYARPFNNVLLRDYLSNFTKQQATAVRNAVATGFFEGLTTQEIVRNIIGTKAAKYKDGIIEVTRTSANRMVRTALNHTANVARDRFYEENNDVVKYYEWISTLDGRTSQVCQARDGNVYEIGKGPLPPAHPNCRSSTAPLFKEDVRIDKSGKKSKLVKVDQGGTRASMDGQVDADLNYNDWLGEQSEEFQDDVLGPTRAKLFREGGLTLDKFVNDRGRKLTLAELKSKFPAAWGKI